MYTCNNCNYETADRTSYYHHTKTKKHLNSINKIDIDDYETLKKKLIDVENEYKHKLELKEEELKQKLLEKDNEKLEAINKIYQEQSNMTINIGTFNYINSTYNTAPPLEKITNFIINGIDTNDIMQQDKFIQDVIHNYELNNLHIYLGNHIIQLYKKKDNSKQSFHTTDTSRLNYAVRIIKDSIDIYESSEDETNTDTENNELRDMEKEYLNKLKIIRQQKELNKMKSVNNMIWTTDKKGYKICKLLIDPTIRHMIRILKKKLLYNLNKKINTTESLNKELKLIQIIQTILDSIDTHKLKNDINKYISPNFNLDKITKKITV